MPLTRFKRSILLLLAYSLLAYALEAIVPFNVNLYESYIPGRLADSLILDSKPEDNLYYERLFVDRRYQNGSDEYICEFAPVNYQKIEVDPELEPEHEILAKATQLIHLSFDKDSCVWAYEFRGWYWTYAFCFGDKVIQYHEGAALASRPKTHKPINPSTVFVLGRFTKASAKVVKFENQVSESQYMTFVENAGRSYRLLDEKSSPFSHHSSQKVILQMVTDGTTCDMTGQPRSMEMVFACSENGGSAPQIMNLLEIKTCHYKMVLHVPKLCEYEPFVPTKQVQDSLVDVACQKVDRVNTYKDSRSSFNDYLGVTVLRDDDDFPVRADNRINIALHAIQDLSGGFYIASHEYQYVSTSEYFNNRFVALFNGMFTDLEDLNYQFGRAVFDSIGKTFVAPSSSSENIKALDWLHKFVIWFEIYSDTGEFLALSRIENTSDGKTPTLNALIVDPVNLLEMNADDPLFVRFQRPDFEAPSNMWNFEIFSEDLMVPYNPRRRVTHSRDISSEVAKESESAHVVGTEKSASTDPSNKELDDEGNPHFVEVNENEQMPIGYQ